MRRWRVIDDAAREDLIDAVLTRLVDPAGRDPSGSRPSTVPEAIELLRRVWSGRDPVSAVRDRPAPSG